jgi:uncharacterized protein with HEPN domain
LPSKRDREAEWMRHILTRLALIREFVGDKDAAALEQDQKSLYAVKAALIEISEAIWRLKPETVARYPTVDWRGAADLRNFFTHEYHRVRTDILVNTVRKSLPIIESAMTAELARRKRLPT